MHTFPSSAPALAAAVAIVAIGILGAVVVPSLMPSDKTLVEGTRIPVGDLGPGSFKLVAHPLQSANKDLLQPYILFVQDMNGKTYALLIPTKEGRTFLPESRPMEAARPCESIVANFQLSEISCARYPAGFTPNASRRWSLEGKKLQTGGTDLQRVEGRIEGTDFVLFRPGAA
jgi:hypothetical protein